MSRGGLLGGDRGSERGGDDRKGGGEGEGGDMGMAHTGSTRSIGAAAGRGHSPEEVAAGPMQGARRGGRQRKKERAEAGGGRARLRVMCDGMGRADARVGSGGFFFFTRAVKGRADARGRPKDA
jgi:hypothetical protein